MHAWSNNDNLLGSGGGSISSSDYQAAEMLVNTYLVVVTSDTYLEKVAKELGNISAAGIKSMMSCSQIEDTVAFRISITSSDPKRSA